jgi:hypothetical protein
LGAPDSTCNLAHGHGTRCVHTLLIEVRIRALQYNWFSAPDERAHIPCEALVPERYVPKCVLGRPIVNAKRLRVFNAHYGGDDLLHSNTELQEEI